MPEWLIIVSTWLCCAPVLLILVMRLEHDVRGPRRKRAILGVLSDRQWRYGRDIAEAAGVSKGAIYALLSELEGEGMVERRTEEPERPGREPQTLYRWTGRLP